MASAPTALPRVTIAFCTQCKWLLRAAYFAQELLSTFGTALGEVALQPSTGGTFVVEIFHASLSAEASSDGEVQVARYVLWDRKQEGGFPETKELKRRVRDIIEPGRDLGHVDGKKKSVGKDESKEEQRGAGNSEESSLQTTPGQISPGTTTPRTDLDVPKPRAHDLVEALRGSEQTAERKFTPMDVDGGEVKNQEVADGIKRNSDGTICEDCN